MLVLLLGNGTTTWHSSTYITSIGMQNHTYKCMVSSRSASDILYYWSSPAENTSNNISQDSSGKYKICALKNTNGANVYQYVDYSIMPTINYKNALIILNYLCKLQNWSLTFKYYNHYYNSNKVVTSKNSDEKINVSSKYIVTNLVKDLYSNNIYSIIKKVRICSNGDDKTFNTYFYNSNFNNSIVTDVIEQTDFVIEISKQ